MPNNPRSDRTNRTYKTHTTYRREDRLFRPLTLSRGDRQDHRYGRAGAYLARDRDPTAVSFDKALTDRQAQPGAAFRTRARRIDAIEALEEMRQMFGRNACPRIADR